MFLGSPAPIGRRRSGLDKAVASGPDRKRLKHVDHRRGAGVRVRRAGAIQGRIEPFPLDLAARGEEALDQSAQPPHLREDSHRRQRLLHLVRQPPQHDTLEGQGLGDRDHTASSWHISYHPATDGLGAAPSGEATSLQAGQGPSLDGAGSRADRRTPLRCSDRVLRNAERTGGTFNPAGRG